MLAPNQDYTTASTPALSSGCVLLDPRGSADVGLRMAFHQVEHDGFPHHFAQGPGGLVQVGRNRWRIRWFLGDTVGFSRRGVLRALYMAINDPYGWENIGDAKIQIVRTMQPELAQFEIALVSETACGPAAAGCYSVRNNQLPRLELATKYLGTSFWTLLVLHELGHAVFSFHDMYTPWHQPYRGVMGNPMDAAATWNRPAQQERQSGQEYMHGSARHVHQH